MVIWIFGIDWRAASARSSDVLARGKRIDLAALVAAFSNFANVSKRADMTLKNDLPREEYPLVDLESRVQVRRYTS